MPRGNKESEEEVEPRTGRRTRSTALSVTDSPLRRSTRTRQTIKDDNSSPESVTSDVSAVSKRTTRRRTPTMESVENVRTLRSRRNSGTSDISVADSDAGEVKRRTTGKSLASLASETPTQTRLRRTTRAGSESKTMSPAVRTTRRTRASSVDPESADGRATPTISTPSRVRRTRTSVLPSQPEVAEETEKEKNTKRTTDMEDGEDVFVVVDDPVEVSDQLSTSHTSLESGNKSVNTSRKEIDDKTDEESRESLEASLAILVGDSESKETTTPKSQEKSASFEARRKLIDNASENAIKDLPKVLLEKDPMSEEKVRETFESSPGNKENEKSLRNVQKTPKSTEIKSSNVVLERIDVEAHMNSANDDKVTMQKSLSPKKQVKSTEGADSIIFLDDTDTDEVEKDEKIRSSRKSVTEDETVEVGNTPSANSSPERLHISPATEVSSRVMKKLSPDENTEDLSEKNLETATNLSEDKNDEEIVVELGKTNKSSAQLEDDDEVNVTKLFKDISAEEFANSKDKYETVNNQSDIDDLVLVGKGGFSGDEEETEEKDVKDKESENSDSDDTVIVQKKSCTKSLSRVSTIEEEESMEVEGEDTEIEDIPESVRLMMECSQRKSLEALKRKSLENEILNTSGSKRLSVKETEMSNAGVDSDEEVQERRKSKNHEELVRMKELADDNKRRKSLEKVATPKIKTANSQEDEREKSQEAEEVVEKTRKSLTKQKTPVKAQLIPEDEPMEVDESFNESVKSLNRSSLGKSKTPTKKSQGGAAVDEEVLKETETVAPSESPNKSRRSLSSVSPRKTATPIKEANNTKEEHVEIKEANEEIEDAGKISQGDSKKGFISELSFAFGKSEDSPQDTLDSPSETEGMPLTLKESPDSPPEADRGNTSLRNPFCKTPKHEESLNKSTKSRKSLDTSKLDDSLNKSAKSDAQNRKSLNNSKFDESFEKSTKSPAKARKSVEGTKLDESLNKSVKSSEKSRNSLEASKSGESSEKPTKSKRKSLENSELDVSLIESSKSLEKSRKSLEASKLNQSLNQSAKSPEKSSRKSLNSSKLEKSLNESTKSRKSLPQEDEEAKFSEDDQDSEDAEDDENARKWRRSASTIVHVNSDSEEDNFEESDSDVEKSRLMGSFLFQQNTSDLSDDEAEDDDDEVNSDIEREYNLAGAITTEYSDDNIPGDDCRASESEDSDSEDNGEDLGDFIVPDDEVEEEEEEEDADNEDSEESPGVEQDDDEVQQNEDEDEEGSEADEDETKAMEDSDDEEVEKLAGKKKIRALKLGDKSIDSSTPKMDVKEKLDSSKKLKNSLNLSVQGKLNSSKASPQVKQLAKSSPLEKKLIKSLKKSGMNQTMVEGDPEIVDTRLLMKEKLNDSMPALKLKKTVGKSAEVQESKRTSLGKNKKVKVNQDRIAEEDEEEVEKAQEILNQLAKKKKETGAHVSSHNDSKKDKSLKRKKSKGIEEAEVPKPKKPVIMKLVDSDSEEDEPVMILNTKTRGQAQEATTKRVKTAKDAKKSNGKVIKAKSAICSSEPHKTLKRLPDDVIENLSDVSQPPKKKLKLYQAIFQPSKTMFDDKHKIPRSLSIDDGYVPLSSSGGTTQFEVVNLKKIKEKKPACQSFRDDMMNRVSRRPISAFLAYQQKLKASGKNKY